MTPPRYVLPGAILLVTRRCSERRFFLAPDGAKGTRPVVNLIFEYLLAVFATRHGIRVHGYVVQGNHFHLVLTDVRGRLPDFMRDLCGLLGRALNHHRGRWEHFWAPGAYSAVALTDQEDVISKMAYTLANPVEAGLVRYGDDWPGARSGIRDLVRKRTVRRPKNFFREHGPMPDVAVLELTAPVGWHRAGFCKDVSDATVQTERAARQKVLKARRTFMGPKRVRRQRWSDAPKTKAPRFGLNPPGCGPR